MCRVEDGGIMGQQSQTNVFLILGNVALRQKRKKKKKEEPAHFYCSITERGKMQRLQK